MQLVLSSLQGLRVRVVDPDLDPDDGPAWIASVVAGTTPVADLVFDERGQLETARGWSAVRIDASVVREGHELERRVAVIYYLASHVAAAVVAGPPSEIRAREAEILAALAAAELDLRSEQPAALSSLVGLARRA